MPIEIFYSYAHKDEALRDRLEQHLATLKHAGDIAVWHDRRIPPGTQWDRQIDAHLNSADIILLLVSADFLASKYCTDIEVARAMQRHAAGTARVIPIILHPCDWMPAPFGKLQGLPKDAKPVSLWPNQDEAFLNVVQGIRAAIADMTTTTTLRPKPPPTHPGAAKLVTTAQIPDYLVVEFVARRDADGCDIGARLQDELAPDKQRLVILWGAGGVGKTTLAAETARALISAFAGRIVWTSALGRADYTRATLLDEIATQLGRPDLRQLASEQKPEAVRALLAEAPTLVIHDNFETVPEAEQKPCADFLHDAPCAALITTRQRIEGERSVPVAAMSLAEAHDYLQLLIAQANDRAIFAQLDHAHIISAAARNPLLLQWVVAQIDGAQDPSAVLADLTHGAGNAAERVFTRSFELPQLTDDGRAVLLALSLFTPDAAREALAEVAGFDTDMPRLNAAVKRLASLWLVKTTAAGSRLALEGLTRQLALARLQQDAHADAYRRRFVAHFQRYAKAHSQPSPAAYDALKAESDNLLSATDAAFAREDWESVVLLADALMRPGEGILSVRGYWDEALWIGGLALSAARALQSETWIANMAHNVAIMYQHRGELDKARQLYDESLEIKNKYGNQPGMAGTLLQLGWLAQGSGKLEEARQLCHKSLRIAHRIGDRRGVARALHQLGRLAKDRGKLAEARRLYNESLEINRELDDQRGIASTLHDLAAVLQDQGEHDKAHRLYTESLRIVESFGDRSGIASTLHQLGNIAYLAGKFAEARRLYSESLEIERKLGDQRGVAMSLAQLGLLAEREGRQSEAVRLLREALSIFERLKSQDAEKARRILARLEAAGQ
ncbi:MAG TPA: tetratricopeptide repeat protein [Pyrinomonadaceae bacterium]